MTQINASTYLLAGLTISASFGTTESIGRRVASELSSREMVLSQVGPLCHEPSRAGPGMVCGTVPYSAVD